MVRNTSIAQTINMANDKMRYDETCKQILSEKIILAWIMKVCLKEYRNLDIWEIASRSMEGNLQEEIPSAVRDIYDAPLIGYRGLEDGALTEQNICYDVRFSASAPGTGEAVGLMINVEAQNDYYPGYPLVKRALYYCSRMISGQYGTVFTHSHYEKIQKVYSIWLCMAPPRKRQETIVEYSIREKCLSGSICENETNYDLICVVMICLGEPSQQCNDNATLEEKLIRLLEVIFSLNLGAEEKKRILEEEYQIPMTESLGRKVDEMCNLSDGVEAKGIKKGIEKGIMLSVLNLMETMKLSMDQAMEALKIPAEKQPEYAAQIRKR